MKNYTITIDTGTTNTRVFLFNEKNEVAASVKSEIGVRITAIDGNNNRLKTAIRGCLEEVLKQAGITYDEVKKVLWRSRMWLLRHLPKTLQRLQRAC